MIIEENRRKRWQLLEYAYSKGTRFTIVQVAEDLGFTDQEAKRFGDELVDESLFRGVGTGIYQITTEGKREFERGHSNPARQP